MAKSKLKELEKVTGRPAPDLLSDLFAQHGTQAAVADAVGVSQSTLNIWLLKLGLEQRTVLVRREVER